MIETNEILHQEMFPGAVLKVNKSEKQFEFICDNNVALRILIISDHIIRLRYSTDGRFDEDFSYAVNGKYKSEIKFLDFIEEGTYFEIQTAHLKVRINKLNLKITFLDLQNKIINQDEKGFHWEENSHFGGNIVKMSKVVQVSENYFGLGDKPTKLNLRGKRIQNWNTDEYGFSNGRDPLYKAIPFYIGLSGDMGYGIFFDNTFRSFFDFASERRTATSYWASGGEMNYYFIAGPRMIDVSRRYTLLTGTPELPPMWALGYHQSKWSYYPESKVKEITDKFRELEIPCDAIYLDIDYMDGFRCFTWDKEKFPDPKRMVAELREQGFKTVVIIDPGIKIDEDYWVFKEGIEQNLFCRRADRPYMKGKVWPGECYFPDFTNPKARKWWSGLYQELIEDIKVKGVWNDMNEPAIFEVESKTFPNDVRHDFDGHPCSHRKAHNVYGMQMARATLKGIKKYSNDERPFVITRSAYSGTQRYSSTWTGDNVASWEHLWVANMQMQRMSISGYSFVGSDVGGFTEHPTHELFIRWIQLAIFHPFFRTHSSGDHGVQEPWSFGDKTLKIVRKFIQLRYQLLPYIYSTFYHYITYGTPMLRPIAFVDQEDENTHSRLDEFMLGDHIMICPIQEPNVKGRYLYLPKGQWYNFWNDQLHQGGVENWVDSDLDKIPIFIKPGAVIPFYPVMQYVGEKEIEILDLHIYYGQGEAKSRLYEDGGEGYDYEKGIYTIKKFTTKGTIDTFIIEQKTNGHYEPGYANYRLIVHGLPFQVRLCKLNGKKVDLSSFKKAGEQVILEVPSSFLEIDFEA
jgi:alpha-glucosidase